MQDLMISAQQRGGIVLDATKSQWTPITIILDDETKKNLKILGCFFLVGWVVFGVTQFVKPGDKGGAGAGGNGTFLQKLGGGWVVLISAIAIGLMFYPEGANWMLNTLGRFGFTALQMFTNSTGVAGV